jgi:thermitase
MPCVRRATLYHWVLLVVLASVISLSPVLANPVDPTAQIEGPAELTAVPEPPVGSPLPTPNPEEPWYLRRIGLPCDPPYHDPASLDPTAVVAVVDTGVDATHPLLKDRLVPGYDFVNNDDNPADDQGHGTATASVVAMVAPPVRIMPVKVLSSSGAGAHSWIANGIIWAADHGADVINLSLGGPYTSALLEQATGYAWSHGVVVVAAVGHEGYSNPTYPASYENVVGVSGTDENDQRATFTNYGDYVAVSAPAVSILVGTRGGAYQRWSGTGLATPQVAGLAGLLRAYHPPLNAAQLRRVIEAGAIDLGDPGWDPYFGHGRIHVCRSLKMAGKLDRDLPVP